MIRRRFCIFLLTLGACFSFSSFANLQGKTLPLSKTFIGQDKFHTIVQKATQEQWHKLPIGERTARFGKEMIGTPYVSYTLEIDNHIEAPSANFKGLDCWTFFEIALGLARMVEHDKQTYIPQDLLAEIKATRYRKGVCNGNYLDRIHYLAEWYVDNHKRKNIFDLNKKLGGERFVKECREMTVLWKSYRYLKHNPELRAPMKKHEERISKLPIYYIPKSEVAQIEPKLQNGDVIGIATSYKGSFCSHVGLAYRDNKNVLRFMHASSDFKKVVLDVRLRDYLYRYPKKHAGILVGRPR
ncbi:MAG: N-acetylmuramoyl-L-alanine amidase-like domain-containing protein [Verrucomicrobiota bacterium]